MSILSAKSTITTTALSAATGTFVDSHGGRAARADLADVKVPFNDALLHAFASDMNQFVARSFFERELRLYRGTSALVSMHEVDAILAKSIVPRDQKWLSRLSLSIAELARASARQGPLTQARAQVDTRSANADELIASYSGNLRYAFNRADMLREMTAQAPTIAEADRNAVAAIAATFPNEAAFAATATALNAKLVSIGATVGARITTLGQYASAAEARHALMAKIVGANRQLVDERIAVLIAQQWRFKDAPVANAFDVTGAEVLPHVDTVGDIFVTHPEHAKEPKQLVGIEGLLGFLLEKTSSE